ncbi:I78 family peptidase inhibitor [Sphingomonas sp.]|uniref:I78 family peptidase inhibitor n=1 Tax=Sphingomonas sp. TaxID=28214 RepID=UPI00286BFB50|nr:I78 family peptidase inhibitor [Sphingomonas sp.]
MHKVLLLVLVPLAACVAGAAQRTTTDQVGPACDARALVKFVGQEPTKETALKLMGFARAKSLRWVAFGGAMTMDYSPQRLTVKLDQQGRIASSSCG